MLAVALRADLFDIGMVVYCYCAPVLPSARESVAGTKRTSRLHCRMSAVESQAEVTRVGGDFRV
jgi:hypothetical protein